jgi:hypothetical protein
MEVSCRLHVPAALTLCKEPRYPFYRRVGGPLGQSGRCEDGKCICLCQESKASSYVTAPVTELLTAGGLKEINSHAAAN